MALLRYPDGQVVFVHGGIRGEVCTVRILKGLKQLAFGRVEEILEVLGLENRPFLRAATLASPFPYVLLRFSTHMHHIFKRFYRSRQTDGRQGVGLGLSLAKRIVEEQGGSLSVESRPGEGSVFRISFPLSG